MRDAVRLAAVQATPAFLDLDATVTKTVSLIEEAADSGAQVIAFGETWIPGYPLWMFLTPSFDRGRSKRAFARLQANSVEVPSPATDRLCAAARRARAFVVVGMNERDARYSGGTLFNAQMFISPDGEIVGVRRKLMPTNAERTIWGRGDGSDLQVHTTNVGRIGASICWEHWMPLTRFAMHAKGEQIHVAAWPMMPETHHLASRHYAFEGRCFVICVGTYLRLSDVPDDFELKSALADSVRVAADDPELLAGGSGVIAPDGSWLAGPVAGCEQIVYGDADLALIAGEQQFFDAAGHYNRPDIFSLSVDNRPRDPISWSTDDAAKDAHTSPG
ncbi:MAG TPA: carbon-nitrogen hydrolase family protein [Mycobacteriales bacterium]